jgi:ribosome-associated protein
VKRQKSPRQPVINLDDSRDPPPEFAGPSKSQRKRDSHALQTLGATLVTLQPAQLRALPLPDPLVEAIAMAQRITSHEGRRRQIQLIGKLMRSVDAEPIRDALARDGRKHREEVALMHSAEHWRARLLDDAGALAELAREHPAVASPEWRALIEGARGERQATQPGRRYRELFRALRELLAGRDDAGQDDAGHDDDHDDDGDGDSPDATAAPARFQR